MRWFAGPAELRYEAAMRHSHWLFAGLVAVVVAVTLARADNLWPLTIVTGSGTHRFNVEVADTPERRAVGLMHRPAMAANAGMLFDFKIDAPVAMWMRNTRIPLDMLFIARDGRIVNIAERTVPFSETSIPSKGPVRAVLELNGGTSARLGIKPGDRVTHPMFKAE
jgi:uncharacterized membrane protein (UPF0127 family)